MPKKAEALFGVDSVPKERLIEIRSDLIGLSNSPGFQLWKSVMTTQINQKRRLIPLRSMEPNDVLRHAIPTYEAQAMENVFQWVEEAMAYCNSVIDKGEQ